MNRAQNPWNVKRLGGSDSWKGQVGTDAAGTAHFDTPEHGARACFINLQSYWTAGHRTIRAIVERATPRTDTIGSLPGRPLNETDAYMRSLAESLGMGLDEQIPNPRQFVAWAVRFMREISRLEGSGFDWPPLLRGAALWCEDRPL